MKKVLACMLLSLCFLAVAAQRVTDPLDRGLVAVKKTTGVFCSWRILAEEYYDVKYNIYRDGTKLNSEPLNVSNYTDASGTASNKYTVSAVVDGVEKAQCAAVSVWANIDGNKNPYLPIKVANVKGRDGNTWWYRAGDGTVTSAANYTINDISVGDVDGDGKIDYVVKRKNQTDQDNLFPTTNTAAFCRIEVYASSINYGLLWYIDCGPNTVYGSDEQWDAVVFDWDQDGRCEVLYRAYANTIIHKSDGSTQTIGSANENIRAHVSHVANMTFTNCGNEYLVYMDGKTGNPYVVMDYPLKRLESSEFSTAINWDSPTSEQVKSYLNAVNTAWGDSYGHRSSKYFMGAPYLDGHKPSIYLGRGIYTRTKMIAYDVNPTTHQLTERWTWANNTKGSGWYGQGYHNYTIADVDEDGRDEIVYGSMVIDDNGKGLSTTGLGHGDAQHTGDLDPFRKGLETFACNEDEPSNNYRDAATCELFFREPVHYDSNGKAIDDGRCMAGNFSNVYPGGMGASTQTGVLSLTTREIIPGLTNDWNGSTPYPMALNFCIYWDGDLLQETINGPGSSEGNLFVDKLGSRIMTTDGTACCNGTKKNPCATGDVIGDWREEIIMRSADNTEFRIYTTTTETPHRMQSLWFDHQYRQAMMWQSEGYNQPPHPSFFVGELEGITAAPPALTTAGKTEIAMDGTITTEHNGKDLLVVVEPSKATNAYARYDMKYSGNISPRSLTINVPVLVSGNNSNSSITRKEYFCLLRNADGSATFSGNMRLVKQGEGALNLYKKTLNHTGATEVWGGTLLFNGTFNYSKLWMNRHTTVNTDGGTFKGGIEMNYNSTLNVTNAVNVSDLKLNYGAKVALTVASASDASQNTQLNITGTLSVDKKDWQYGPQYLAPVLQVNSASALALGDYKIGTLANVDGDLNDIIIEGSFAANTRQKLVKQNGDLVLKVYDPSDDYVGNLNNTSGWWTAFSDSYLIKEGFKANIKFTNYGNSTKSYYNWVLIAANGIGHSTTDRSDYAEYFAVRADQYGWGNYYNTAPTLTLKDGTFNESIFRSDMAAGAEVDMNVEFKNSVLTVNSTMTANGRVYIHSFTSNTMTDKEATLFFTVENAHITKPVVEITPLSSVKMTYVNYDAATTSYGEVTKATAGYNKLSGGNVAFTNTGYGVDYITYIQLDLSNYKKTGVSVNNVAFTMKGSGSTDSQRTCCYGIGYNNSTWSSTMTYNTANRSITTIGGVQWTNSKSSTAYTDFSWDITDVFNNDADGIITLLVYETSAAGGYIIEPNVVVDCSVSLEEEPVHVHSYVYTDNGNGTHTKRCSSCGDVVANEAHGNICDDCGICHLVDGAAFTNAETKQYNEVTYTRTFTHTKWNALCLPFAINVEDYLSQFDIAEIFAFCPYADTNGDGEVTAEDDDMLVVFKKSSGTTMPNKPYLIRTKEQKSYTINAADGMLYSNDAGSVMCYTTKKEYNIQGVYSTVTATADNGYYYMGSGKISHRTSGSTNITPYRWYMTITASDSYGDYAPASSAKSIGIVVIGEDMDEATAVRLANSASAEKADGAVYTIQGIKTAGDRKLAPGIYIRNGKKFFVR